MKLQSFGQQLNSRNRRSADFRFRQQYFPIPDGPRHPEVAIVKIRPLKSFELTAPQTGKTGDCEYRSCGFGQDSKNLKNLLQGVRVGFLRPSCVRIHAAVLGRILSVKVAQPSRFLESTTQEGFDSL